MKQSILFFLTFIFSVSFAQNNKQTIRGAVIDKLSQAPVPGASVLLVNSMITAITDSNGYYVFLNLKPGRYDLKVTNIGYREALVSNILLTSGKESIVDFSLEDEFKRLNEVVVKGSNKASSINKMAIVSARTFSMDEVNRFAGGRSDPARLAANFAGVSTPDDSRNDLVIRGNSPTGVLWKIDGMNVTNPNHFASIGTTGGAVSALNTNLLKNSDFFTSAFPAEYGNANAGVFDIGFRNGNSKKRETTLQLGVITGLEATTEGPINKDNGSSYLVGYRYSLAGIAQSMGINIGTTATPTYQDLSFKFNSGTSKLGKFSLFGILATSTINLERGTNANSLYGNGNEADFDSKIGIIGLNHYKQLSPKSYISSTIGLNYSKSDLINYDFDRTSLVTYQREISNTAKAGYNFSTSYNSKINSRLFLKLGIEDQLLGLDLYYTTKQNATDPFKQIWNYSNQTNFAQAYAQLKYNLSSKFTFNGGIHSQQFFLNKSTSIEPRLGLKYDVDNSSSITFGYGLHSQMQPINVYFLQTQNPDGSIHYNNQNLGFTKSHHFVAGYSLQLAQDWRIKSELYYQSLYNVPVNTFASNYSMLNTGAGFKTDLEDNLTNKGTGKNYGMELTIEKFFSKGYYGLLTATLYESKYTASDGIERNTAFNGKFVYNLLAGKEWSVGAGKRNKTSIDFKFTNAGGRYYTPIDLVRSQNTNREQLSSDVYTVQYPNYLRMDLKLGYTFNSKVRKISQTISLDLQNVTNHANVFSQSYDNRSKSLSWKYQLGFFPNFVYKIQF